MSPESTAIATCNAIADRLDQLGIPDSVGGACPSEDDPAVVEWHILAGGHYEHGSADMRTASTAVVVSMVVALVVALLG